MISLLDRHADQIAGVHSCFDRVLIQGTLPELCHAAAMTSYLHQQRLRIFDYAQFAQPLRDELRANAERIAAENGIEIEFVRKVKAVRKDSRIRKILATRGGHPGLVHIFSAMESCTSYKPWHDKKTHRTFLRPDGGKSHGRSSAYACTGSSSASAEATRTTSHDSDVRLPSPGSSCATST